MAGEVMRGTERVSKPSTLVGAEEELIALQRPRYVGRGGCNWRVLSNPSGLIPRDGPARLGASTGGFTDCLLQHGAKRVHAVDVGTNQLAWKLRNDTRVVVKEQLTDATSPSPTSEKR